MAYAVLIYGRMIDGSSSKEYCGRAREWIAKILKVPGAISFLGFRAADGAPNTMSMTEFNSAEHARQAASSEEVVKLLDETASFGIKPKLLIMEASPLTPRPVTLESLVNDGKS